METRPGAPGYLFGLEPSVFLKAQARRLRAGGSALSVADGEGRNGVWLAEQGLDVLAIDFSPTALAKAQKLAQERGVRLRTEVVDVTTWRWPAAVALDVIVATRRRRRGGPAGVFRQSPRRRSSQAGFR